ncbi:hypothetical protein D0868_06741 [Hortaea werneckii]|uniref:Uncharacterized protein n=1 Tax=Hortaea werneckii TaxID=91943 RepID=A0A3M6YPL6_HORWE|nr:hypothetical protein D0868_06741 [Hortaea werneckii]
MGYKCKDDQCFALSSTSIAHEGTKSPAGASATSPSSTVHSASTLSAIAAAASATESMSITSTARAGDPAAIAGSSSSGSSSVFSGTSFAAGFAPGILIGALLCGALFFYLLRKKTRQPNKTYVDNEKGQLSSDTLTDLGTLSARPTMHGRSISGPVAEASAGHRTEFLRTTPPQHKTYTGPESHWATRAYHALYSEGSKSAFVAFAIYRTLAFNARDDAASATQPSQAGHTFVQDQPSESTEKAKVETFPSRPYKR